MNKFKIKGVVFDLDNTLLDFMRMKEFAVKAAIKGMIEAGLMVDEVMSFKEIIVIYEQYGWENQKVFDVFIKSKLEKLIINFGCRHCSLQKSQRSKFNGLSKCL